MSYLEVIPDEMLEKIISRLPPENITLLIQTSKVISNICDRFMACDNFYYNYINNNFNCEDYDLDEWKPDSIHKFSDKQIEYRSWKDLLKLLTIGKFIPSVGINILLTDTFNTIRQKIGNKIRRPINNIEIIITGFENEKSKNNPYNNYIWKLRKNSVYSHLGVTEFTDDNKAYSFDIKNDKFYQLTSRIKYHKDHKDYKLFNSVIDISII